MTKRIHTERESYTEPTGLAEGASPFAWLDEESGELLSVHVRAASDSFVEELTALGFQRPPLANEH